MVYRNHLTPPFFSLLYVIMQLCKIWMKITKMQEVQYERLYVSATIRPCGIKWT